jgi:hypothetical protein
MTICKGIAARYAAALIALLLLSFSIRAAVILRDSTLIWRTVEFTIADDYSIKSGTYNPNKYVDRTFNTKVLENEYIRVTLMPEFGGRIASIFYKPTEHEQLYQNPSGGLTCVDKCMYYLWITLYGGIFPTFPEPEHGKTWCRPWETKVVKETADTVSVSMSWIDTVDFARAPSFFAYGRTDIACDAVVTLISGQTGVHFDIELRNDRSTAVSKYEYWTNTGFAPGCEPGKTQCFANTKIITPLDTVEIDRSQYSKLASAEKRISGNIHEFKNLKIFANHPDKGIAYGYPKVTANFWGMLNPDNKESMLRIADNTKTPGLKLWTFGYQSINADANDYERPFVELWAGITRKFKVPTSFPANSKVSIREYYTPATGLTDVTHASERMLINLRTDKASYDANSDTKMTINLELFSTVPAESLSVEAWLEGTGLVSVGKKMILPDAKQGNTVSLECSLDKACPGLDSAVVHITNTKGAQLLHAAVPVSIANATGQCSNANTPAPAMMHSPKKAVPHPGKHFDINGRAIRFSPGTHMSSGVYIIQGETNAVRKALIPGR